MAVRGHKWDTIPAVLLTVIKEGMDEIDQIIEMDVPPDAARDFLMGHIRTETAIFVKEWNANVFDIDNVKRNVDEITSV